MSQPMISIILCTRNRARYLTQTLQYYTNIISKHLWELVVVDNGSTDSTLSVIKEFTSKNNFFIRIVKAPEPGLSHARNIGWKAAAGELIAFTDDDCYPESEFIDKLCASFDDSRIAYIGGRVLLHDPEDYPITIQTSTSYCKIPPHSFLQGGLIHGANLATRKIVLDTIGGFDELLGAGTTLRAGEDLEWISRASAAGFIGAYDPGPTVRHHHRRRTESDVNALRRSYDIGNGAYLMKCFLDQNRRSSAARHWYWNLRVRLPLVLRSKREALSIFYEGLGAIAYLSFRFLRRIQ